MQELNVKGTPVLHRALSSFNMGIFNVLAFEGGSRSSKTYSIIQFLVIYALNNRDSFNRIIIARKKKTWIISTVWPDFKKVLMDMGLFAACKINNTVKTIEFLSTSFEFVGLDDAQRLHGMTSDVFWLNEAMETTKDDFDQLEQRCSRFCIIDYNPSSEEHWIYDNICKRPDCYFDHSTMLDNPFIPENMRRKILSYEPTEANFNNGTADKRKWLIYGLGKRAKIEGLVFESYTVIPEIPSWVTKRWRGIDFGYTADPTGCLDVGFLENTLYLDEEFYKTNMLTKDIVNDLKGLSPRKIWSESADPRLIDEIYHAGFNIQAVKKYPGSIKAGIDYMKGVKICITEQSLNLKKEFDNYTWMQDKNGKWLNEPIDDFNHCFTSDTLVTTICGEKKIVDMTPNDYVLTSNGYRKVTKFFDNGHREVLLMRLVFSNLIVEVEATPDHKIKTTKGWKQLQELTKGDVLFLCKSSMVKSIRNTKENDTLQEGLKNCTGLFGHSTMEKYPRGITSIIKTKTPHIMTSQILNSSIVKSIYRCICKKECKEMNLLTSLKKKWITQGVMQINGTAQKRVLNGIANKVKRLQKIFLPENTFASTADVSLRKNLKVKLNSAPISVNQRLDEHLGLTMKQESVQYAESLLLSINTARLSFAAKNALVGTCQKQKRSLILKEHVKYVGVNSQQDRTLLVKDSVARLAVENTPQALELIKVEMIKEGFCNVYDIEVDEMHEFFANGILVHNCIDPTRYVCMMELMGKVKNPVKNFTGVR